MSEIILYTPGTAVPASVCKSLLPGTMGQNVPSYYKNILTVIGMQSIGFMRSK